MARRALVLSLALAASAGCREPPQVTPQPVRLYVAPGLPGELAVELARGFRIALPTLVPTLDQAELAWLRSPGEALALGERLSPHGAPEQPGVPAEYLDPQRRWAPVGATTTVLIAPAHGGVRLTGELRQLAEPPLRGRVALVGLGLGEGPQFVASLELGFGEWGTRAWLAALAANAPIVLRGEEAVVESVASGRAAVGLVDSLTAGRASARSGLRILFTDQDGGGSAAIPTALVVLRGASPAARSLSAWLASGDAEEVLAERAIGLLPLRGGARAAAGILPVWKLVHFTPSWTELARREKALRKELERWPARSR